MSEDNKDIQNDQPEVVIDDAAAQETSETNTALNELEGKLTALENELATAKQDVPSATMT